MNETHCVFAKGARIWGSPRWIDESSFEENIKLSLQPLQVFLKVGMKLKLDGFVLEIVGNKYGDTTMHFADTVRRALTIFGENDPAGLNCMKNLSRIGKKGWNFDFNREPIFITTFAPCYPSDHCRYLFGAGGGKTCYILFQPEYSFFWRNIGNDTPETNWDNPQTSRDKIRVDYKKNNRAYYIPKTIYYSPANFIIPPLKLGQPIIEWWIPQDQIQEQLKQNIPNTDILDKKTL